MYSLLSLHIKYIPFYKNINPLCVIWHQFWHHFFDFCRFLIKSDKILKSRNPSQNGHSRHSMQLDKFHIMKTSGSLWPEWWLTAKWNRGSLATDRRRRLFTYFLYKCCNFFFFHKCTPFFQRLIELSIYQTRRVLKKFYIF